MSDSPMVNNLKPRKPVKVSKLLTPAVLMLISPVASMAETGSLPVPSDSLSALTNANNHAGIAASTVGTASASISTDGQTMTINQTSNTAIIDWQSFDISQGNSVHFVQPSSTSIALNDIHEANASQIFGNLLANGQVYLVNNNGFVFGAGAAVNVNTLVATSLNISDSVFQQGITNVVTSGAPTTSTAGNAKTTPVAAFTGDGSVYLNTGNGSEKISVLVQKGATINASDTGRVILSAPKVENDGTITAPDGQVILVAATDKVYLQTSSSSDLRGLLVEVKTGGDVKNLGSIITERGNSTMMGFAVSQQGVVSASTSVALGGSVRLLAREGAQLVNSTSSTQTDYILEPLDNSTVNNNAAQATVTMTAGSLTQVTLDSSAGNAVVGQVQPQSIVDVEAGAIAMQAGAQIVAHGGLVNLTASLSPSSSNVDFPTAPILTPSTDNPSRILLASGSSIDVSGVQNVVMPMSSNSVDLTLYSYELRNDPWQKNGLLYGQNVHIDTRSGTDLADISEAVAAQTYSVFYRNTEAGSVNLNSEGTTFLASGASINISGGSIAYQAGTLETTELMSNGVLYNMATASPDLTYQQLVTISQYQAAYQQGMAAGSININSRDLLIAGTVLANTVNGQYQRTADTIAVGGQLNIDTTWTHLFQQDVLFSNQVVNTTIPALGQAITSPIVLSNALFSQGLNHLELKTGGNLSIPADSHLRLPEFASLNLQAGAISIAGSILAPAGSVSLQTSITNNPLGKSTGVLQLSAGSKIDTSGLWFNDIITAVNGGTLQPAAINAGNISLQAQGDLLLSSGSSLSANAGAWLASNLPLNVGTGGNISLSTAGFDQSSQLQLGANLSSYALYQGGSLSITANSLVIAETAPVKLAVDQLYLPASLLETGGFSNYNFTANNGSLTVAANTHIQLKETNWQLNNLASNTASGVALANLVQPVVLTENMRQPVNLSLNMLQTIAGVDTDLSVAIGDKAQIIGDAKATISLNSDANISVDGVLQAPAGTINLNLLVPPNNSSDPGYNPNQAITLWSDADLNASATTVFTPNAANLVIGSVLNGGTVNLIANRGYILTDSQSDIAVSGTNAALDIINSSGYHLQTIVSNAGSINLSAAEGMVLQGQFQAAAGAGVAAAGRGSVAEGGSLNITLDAQNRGQPYLVSFPTAERDILVTANTVNHLSSAQIASGIIPSGLDGQANVSVKQIQQAGFANLALNSVINLNTQPADSPEPQTGGIVFVGDIDLSVPLSISLNAANISHQWASSADTGHVQLNTNMFTLGSNQNQTLLANLSNLANTSQNNTAADFTVNADYIALLGASQISSFANTHLNSLGAMALTGVNPNNANQLAGELALTGDLTLSATEIYPTTLSQYSINASNNTLTINNTAGKVSTPLSAGGQLSLTAKVINDAGVLLAPFGSITLNAASSLTLASGSLTAVSDTDLTTIPFGETQGNGEFWIYPLGTFVNIESGTPEKAISLISPTINSDVNAALNLNGGGDLQAYEFSPLPGGSLDYLSHQLSYAIFPTIHSGYAPYDPLFTANAGISLGETVYLSASTGIAAGNYLLFPAYYALLPGAYLIMPQVNTHYMTNGEVLKLADGNSMVAGYQGISGSQVSSSLWSGFEVQKGSAIVDYSPYVRTTASHYFTTNTPTGEFASLPQDAGDLSIIAGQALTLAGDITAKAELAGLGGLLNISASNIDVVKQTPNNVSAGTVVLNARALNNLGVDSVLIGGLRSRSSSGTQLTVNAQSINVAENVSLQAPEILLAASQSISVNSGASITAVGSPTRTDSILTVVNANTNNDDGALLRVSNAEQATVIRNTLTGTAGDLSLASGARLSSSGSILVDATHTGSLLGTIIMSQGALSLQGSLITLGGSSAANTGFQLNDSTLQNLNVGDLSLISAGAVTIADTINLNLNNLIINAAGINAALSSNQTASINASNITLENTGNTNSYQAVNGQAGGLSLQANTVTFASGVYTISGFKQVHITANSALVDSGSNSINSAGDMTITSPVWTAQAGADTHLNLSNGQFSLLGTASNNNDSALGADLSLSANSINIGSAIDMAAGVVQLTALQALNINAGAVINTAGETVTIGNQTSYAAGGSINLNSVNANINLNKTAELNVSASGAGNAGSLSLTAENGQINLDAQLLGHASQTSKGGSFNLYDKNTDLASFSNLNQSLSAGGFTGNLAFRLGQGDIAIADSLTANNISIIADSGLLTLSGTLNVDGIQAGNILLAGENGVQLLSGANLNAVSSGVDNSGGSITLMSAPINTNSLGVSIADKVSINVAGGNRGGEVNVMVNQLGTQDAAVAIANNNFSSASQLNVYAMQHYVDQSLSNSQFQTWLTDSQSFVTLAASNADLSQRLSGFNLLPGIDIVNSANLNWNISTNLSVATPGLLSIRSAADLAINQNLSDGFLAGSGKLVLETNTPSWSYNLIAGADLTSANLSSINADQTTGTITIGSNTSVRTGTGNIVMAAADNIVLTDWTSTIYTAGEKTQITDPYAAYRPATFAVQFPVNGGNLSLTAGNAIIGASTVQLMSDWLQRSGNWNPNANINRGNLPTAWGIDFGSSIANTNGSDAVNSSLGFRENIGALGGGNITLQTGGNIQDLSVMIPTTAIASVVNGVLTWHEQGGGNLQINAGGNIAGGVFYVEQGTANIHAQAAIIGGTEYTSGSIFALGNAQFNVSAGNGIAVGDVLNPFVIAQAGVNSNKTDYFSSYTNNSAINFLSLAGDISFNNAINLIENKIVSCTNLSCSQNDNIYHTLNSSTEIAPLLALYPGNVTAVALTASININNAMLLYPAANSSFSFLAEDNFILNNTVSVNQLDLNPKQFLYINQPTTSFSLQTAYWLASNYENTLAHAAVPVHSNDTTINSIVAEQGSVIGIGTSNLLITAKATSIRAGENLDNFNSYLQNLPGVYQDLSSIMVGGSIVYPAIPDPVTGSFQNSESPGIIIAGPGALDVWSVGNINLGVSGGIVSVGALYNTALPSIGASINLLAGEQASHFTPAITDYLQAYVNNANYSLALNQQFDLLKRQASSAVNNLLMADIENLLATISQANNSNQDSNDTALQAIVPILFSQFRLAATEYNAGLGDSAYQIGYQAIDLLFPQASKADITLDFSAIQTLAGGDINLLAPGGQLNVGLAASDLSTGKSAANLGIVAQAQGDVNIYSKGDVLVNQSRVFTLKDGNITIWSENGNIDAGRGAKSSLAAPLPIADYDANGNLILTYPATVSGSGIRAQSGYNSGVIGNISLIAPHGIVNAGEAGIGGYDVTIAATAVVGATNIQSIGLSLGVPTVPVAIVIPDSVSNVTAAVSKAASINFNSENEDESLQTGKNNPALVIFDSQIIGFGHCSVSDVKEDKAGCGG